MPKSTWQRRLSDRVLNFLIPHGAAFLNHPIYALEVRQQRSQRTLRHIVPYTTSRVGIITGILLAIWLCILAYHNGSADWYTYSASDTSESLFLWVFYASAGLNLLLDFFGVVATAGSINREKTSTNWDLLTVTTVRQETVIRAKHIAAQVRIWRLVTLIFGLRMGFTTWGLLHTAGTSIWFNGLGHFIQEAIDEFRHEPVETPLALYLFALIFVVYMLESLWRARLVTAIGLAASARIQNTTSAILAGFAGVVLMWITQAIILIAMFWLSFEIGNYSAMYDDDAIVVIITLVMSGWAAVIYGYYRLVRERLLKWATRRAFAQ